MNLVIFDVDGTLIDSQHMIVSAMERAFGAQSRPVPSRDRILSIVGLSLETAMGVLCPEEPDEIAVELASAYKAAFFELRHSPEHHEPMFPGAIEALDRLAEREDLVLGIATGKSQRGVRAILDLHDLHGRFATIQTADLHPSKPDPSMVLTACAEVGVLPQHAVMIGDTSYDMEMGRAAGASAIGVSWGYHAAESLKATGATALIRHFDELDAALANCFAETATA
ncbi:HAD-IA family hydrolase [Flaviflagellibacter deserti]|uniref:HAD-IA family hydrolase n=1 Tax=Flaviflagellibacter deserti TaxID=2267266 RepID=A0ABV9Z366_9HYPH